MSLPKINQKAGAINRLILPFLRRPTRPSQFFVAQYSTLNVVVVVALRFLRTSFEGRRVLFDELRTTKGDRRTREPIKPFYATSFFV
jgi:hypothetical protein